ncbi:hypothetical protein L2E82_16691 [Cichorium intybus]|uniref:Uncharacterized protein n=1 Tax=Cichorium intybus TaxID=13427 RepID=A0ACB9F697_CICIN|nr:hypothetical protein L2E82_16691 [Cichorium intybus]
MGSKRRRWHLWKVGNMPLPREGQIWFVIAKGRVSPTKKVLLGKGVLPEESAAAGDGCLAGEEGWGGHRGEGSRRCFRREVILDL